MKKELGQNYLQYQEVKRAIRYHGIQTRMPFEIIIVRTGRDLSLRLLFIS
jgi:hypothetical protein